MAVGVIVFTQYYQGNRPLAHVLVVGGRGRVRGGAGQTQQVAGAAQQAAVQRVAALVGLVRQLHAALPAHVAVHVEVLVHGHYAYRLFRPLHGGDSYEDNKLLYTFCRSGMAIWTVKIHGPTGSS